MVWIGRHRTGILAFHHLLWNCEYLQTPYIHDALPSSTMLPLQSYCCEFPVLPSFFPQPHQLHPFFLLLLPPAPASAFISCVACAAASTAAATACDPAAVCSVGVFDPVVTACGLGCDAATAATAWLLPCELFWSLGVQGSRLLGATRPPPEGNMALQSITVHVPVQQAERVRSRLFE